MTMMGWLFLPETITKSITFQNFNPKIKSSTRYTYNAYTYIFIINYNTYRIGYYYSNKSTQNIIVSLVTKDILKTRNIILDRRLFIFISLSSLLPLWLLLLLFVLSFLLLLCTFIYPLYLCILSCRLGKHRYTILYNVCVCFV